MSFHRSSNETPHSSTGTGKWPAGPARRVVLLAAILLMARLPLLGHPIPVHGDENEFVAAIGFPAAYPVHHPGYPLWVALGTLLARLGLSPYASYQAWSVFASVAAPVLLYIALRRSLVPRRSAELHGEQNAADGLAWWTALAFGVCPLVWFLGTTALNYSLACAVGLWIVLLCLRARHAAGHYTGEGRPSRRSLPLIQAAALLAVALLFRPDLLLWLGPLLIWAAWQYPMRARIGAALVLVAGLLVLLVVTGLLYGRVAEPAATPDLRHTLDVILNTSIFRLGLIDGLARGAVKLAAIVGWTIGLPYLICLIGVWTAPAAAGHPVMPPAATRSARTMLLVWMAPLTAFLLLIHMSEAGHTILLIPAAYWFMADLLHRRLPPKRAAGFAAAMAMASILQFTTYPWSAKSSGMRRILDAKVGYLSAAGLRRIDERRQIHTPGDFWKTGAHDAESDVHEQEK